MKHSRTSVSKHPRSKNEYCLIRAFTGRGDWKVWNVKDAKSKGTSEIWIELQKAQIQPKNTRAYMVLVNQKKCHHQLFPLNRIFHNHPSYHKQNYHQKMCHLLHRISWKNLKNNTCRNILSFKQTFISLNHLQTPSLMLHRKRPYPRTVLLFDLLKKGNKPKKERQRRNFFMWRGKNF